jgi:multidrug efflux pump subunit AcrB
MDVTQFAIERQRVTLVLLLAIAAFGFGSYSNMPRSEDPGFLIRTAIVQTQLPGASPTRIEQLITDKLEKAIQEMPEIDAIRSTSKPGVSIISVDIQERYTDLRPIWDQLRRKVDRAKQELPSGIIGPIVDDEFGDVFGTVLTMTSDGFEMRELKDYADQVRDELLLIEDVAKVEIYGDQEERVFIEYSNARLTELQLSPPQLQAILQARNIINPGGQVRTPFETIVIEPSGNFESFDEIERALIPLPSGELVYLNEIAEVRRGYVDPPRAVTRVNGERGFALAISMREGGNILRLGEAIIPTLERVRADLPLGIELNSFLDQATIVDKKVSDFVSNLLQAVGIVAAVMLISLGIRTGIIVASLIPMAIVATFVVMPYLGVGIDQMSLAALIIALGLLVDNAIVMSESIMVSMQEGKSAVDAALSSARELRTSLLISSLTTSAAFLPIFLAESAVGEYTGSLFKVVTTTLLASWVFTLTMIPLFCVIGLKVKPRSSEAFGGKIYASYRALLRLALRRPLVTMLIVALAFVGSMSLFRFVPVIFFPDSDRATLTATLEMPTGTPLAATEAVVQQVEQFIQNELAVTTEEWANGSDGVLSYTAFLGDSPPMFVLGFSGSQVSPEYAAFVLNTTTRSEADRTTAALREFCETIPGLSATVEPLSSGPGAAKPIEVRISGRDSERIFELADQIKLELGSIPGAINIVDDWGARSKKLIVKVDPARAQRAGVTNQDVATTLSTTFSGLETTHFREDGELIPVMLRSVQARGVEEFGSLNIFSQQTGSSVPAEQVSDVELAWQPSKILRRNRLKTVTVQADLRPGVTATEVNRQLAPWLADNGASWPIGYGWELGGEDESSNEANASIGAKLPIAGVLIVLLLVWQFNSLRKPAIILVAVPLALIGVVIGLLVMRSYFGFMTLLGVVSLAGIVINNAIVLIDRIDIEINENGLSPYAAIVEAGQRRFRPIVLTTITTLGGMIPLYLGGGPMFEPMAVAIMFGLVVSTALTLGVVPVLYALLYRVQPET